MNPQGRPATVFACSLVLVLLAGTSSIRAQSSSSSSQSDPNSDFNTDGLSSALEKIRQSQNLQQGDEREKALDERLQELQRSVQSLGPPPTKDSIRGPGSEYGQKQQTVQTINRLPLATPGIGERKKKRAPKSQASDVQALEAIAQKGNEQAIDHLMKYRISYGDPADTMTSKSLANVLIEQPAAFTQKFQQLSASDQAKLIPYLETGWQKAAYGQNVASSKYQKAREQLNIFKAQAAKLPKPEPQYMNVGGQRVLIPNTD